MNIDMIVLNIILILFPILIYLVFSCYNLLTDERIKRVVFIITMCTSFYLSMIFNITSGKFDLLLLFFNIPVLICYFKKESKLAVIFSVAVALIGYWKYGFNIYFVGIKYFGYLITYLTLYKRKNFQNRFLILVAILQGLFISFEFFNHANSTLYDMFDLIINTIIIYAVTFISIYLFRLSENITSLYVMVNNTENEIKLKNALFKMTHEVKNPLAVCKGYLDMLDLDNRDKAERYVYIIKTEINRSLNIMSDFMEFNKIKICKEEFDMSLLLEDIYDSFKVLLTDKKIDFKFNNTYDTIYYFGDYNRLKQVFVNVLKNSVESFDIGGIIKIDVKIINKIIHISIIDNGCGMDSEELSKIKEMFFTTKKNGTGLGVALSNEIIVAHGGEINYDSKKGIGTTCTISLPM